VNQAVKVTGPYREGDKWRLVLFEHGKRSAKLYEDRETAELVRGRILDAADARFGRTIGQAVDEWIEFKQKSECVERTLRAMREKLAFLPSDLLLLSLSQDKAESLYLELTTHQAAATHHASLKFAKALFRWCIKKKYVEQNPFVEVQKIGKANKGKLQLRTDEAKRLSNYLIERASRGDYRALALLVQVLLGLRSGEVLGMKKRDLDCGGTQVVVEGTKNENAKRIVKLKDAPIVQELLARRIAPLAPEALIFVPDARTVPLSTTSLHKALVMFCKHAGVPQVCPHSLRGLNATLAVEAGDTCSAVARALGHGSDAITRKHYIAQRALDSARTARVASALLSTRLDGVLATLRDLSADELDAVCSAVGYQRRES